MEEDDIDDTHSRPTVAHGTDDTHSRIINMNSVENSVEKAEETHSRPTVAHGNDTLVSTLSTTTPTPTHTPSFSMKDLISRFCPLFVFSPKDTHRPVSWETILRSSQVANWDGTIALSNADMVADYTKFHTYCAAQCIHTREIGDIRAIESCPYQLRMMRQKRTTSGEQPEVYCMLSEPIWNGVRWGMYLTYWIWVPTFRSYRLLDRRLRNQHKHNPLTHTCKGEDMRDAMVQKSMRKLKAEGDGYSPFDPHHSDAPWVSHPGVVTVYFECSRVEDIEGEQLALSDIQTMTSSLDALHESIRWISPRLMRIYMSHHTRGRWYRPEDCQMQAGRVYAYAVEGTAGRVYSHLPSNSQKSQHSYLVQLFSNKNSSKEPVIYDGIDNIVSLVPPHHTAFEEEIQGHQALYYFSGVVGNDISPMFVPQLQMPWLAIDMAVDPENPFSRKTWCKTLTRYGCTSLIFLVWTYGTIEPFVILQVDDYPLWIMIMTRALVVLSSLVFTRMVMR